MRYDTFYQELKKVLSWTLIFLLLLSLLRPSFLDATVIDGALENILSGENNNYVGLANSGTYTVNFSLSGTLDAGNTVLIEATDGFGNENANYNAMGGESAGSVDIDMSTSGFAEGPITFNGTVYLTGTTSPVVASGIVQTGVFDMTPPVITSTGTYGSGATSVSFSNIGVNEVNFSGATLSYSGVTIGSEVGSVVLTGVVSNLNGTVTGLTPSATYTYSITAVDLAGNSTTMLAGNFSTDFLPITGSFNTASGSFVFMTGSVALTGLQSGAVYEVLSGSTRVSSGVLVASAASDTIALNPAYFSSFGFYPLTLSGTNTYGSFSGTLDAISLYSGPVDYSILYPSIGSSLTSGGIYNNFSGVTNGNVTAYTSLYFEKPGYGKITFTSPLNLADSGTVSFLQSLGSYLGMNVGYIDFMVSSGGTASGSLFQSAGAALDIYFTGSTFPAGPLSLDTIVVRDASGNAVSSSGILSNLSCSTVISGVQTCSFDTSHFTSFDFKPILVDVHVESNNTLSGSLAKVGDTVSISFTGSETLTGITASMSGVNNNGPLVLVGSGSAWTTTGMVTTTGSMIPAFSINFSDMTGNTGATVTGTTDGSSVQLDSTTPTVILSSSATGTITGPISILADFSESPMNFSSGDISVTNGTVSGLTPSSATGYTFTVTPSILSGSLSVSIGTGTFSDNAGNMNSAPSNILTYLVNTPDTTPPIISVSSHSDNAATTGSTATITGIVTDAGGVASVTVNGSPATIGTGSWSHTLTGIVAGTNTFTIVATDTSGNTGSTLLHLIRISVPSSVNATLSGTTEAVITFSTDISATGVLLYGISSGSLTSVMTGSTSGTSHTFTLSGLSTDTLYYYQVYGVSGGQNGQLSTLFTFKTPVVLDSTTLSGSVTATGSLYLSGSTATGVTFSNTGSLSIMSTTESGSLLSFSFSGLMISASGGSWDGVIQAPEVVSMVATGADTGYVFIDSVYQIGNPSTELVFSGQTVTVTLYVSTSLNGQILRIYRSVDGGTTYNFLTTCTVGVIGNCSFTTNQLSLFALAAVIDTTPNAFAFVDVSNAELNMIYESNLITITGINAPTSISVVGGQYSVSGGAYTASASTVNNGDTIRVRTTSAASFATAVNVTLSVGGVVDIYTVTTKSSPTSGGGGVGPGGPAPSYPSTSSDFCPNGDYSSSYYDGMCNAPPVIGGAVRSITKNGNEFTITITTGSGTSIRIFQIPEVILLLQDIRFADVSTNWARDYIYALVVRGIINNAVRYRPNDRLTRAEFLKIVINTAGWQMEDGVMTIPFRDVSSTIWYAPYVRIGLDKGMISGTNIFFRPNDPITRAEAMKILMVALGAKIDGIEITFSDVNRNSDLTRYVETAKLLGIVSGQTMAGRLRFRPNDPITRAEIAKVVVNALGL